MVLFPLIENRLIEILNMIADCEDFQIIECNTEKDHIHILINCSPQHYIPNIIQKLKGISSRLLMKEFGEILRKRLWGGTYGILVILYQLFQKIPKNK